MNKTDLLDRFARDGESRVLLGRVLDRLAQAERRSLPAHTGFLSPAQQADVEELLAAAGNPRRVLFGGYEDAERRVCAFLPDWQGEEDFLSDPQGPVAAIEARFPAGASLNHRDVLGSLMGLGITREKIGDILAQEERCQILVLRETLPILLSQWESAGRWRLAPEEISLDRLRVKPPQVKTLRDTVAALRLDAVCACGFSVSRSRAAEWVAAGRVSVNHRECTKGDRPLARGDVISCRGQGKCVLREVLGRSRKGRLMIVIERYL